MILAVIGSDVSFFENNVLRNVEFWTLENADVSGSEVVIHPGGYAFYYLSDDLFNALSACRYRKITFEAGLDISEDADYNNIVDIAVKIRYRADRGVNEYVSINCTKLNSSYYEGVLHFERIIDTENYDMELCVVYVFNRSDKDIVLKSCRMLRSSDVSSSQIGEAIGWSISLEKCIAYSNGCELYFTGQAAPDRLYYMEDVDGNFSGINVNRERIIKFERNSGIMIG